MWPAYWGRRDKSELGYQRERWATPDGDFTDADWLHAMGQGQPNPSRPLLVLFHGLEGSSQSHYARSCAACAQAQGWDFVVPHFRGCSGEINGAPRAYHSGDFAEIDWMLRQIRQRHAGPMIAIGVSLGGNALLRWAQEMGAAANQQLRAAVSVCAPIDLAASGRALERGLSRLVYTPMFLQTMKPKALQKWMQHPGLFDKDAMLAARTLYAFDNVFTAPLHGFKDTNDYWKRASAKPRLSEIQLPTLILNARNDPFVPKESLPSVRDVSGSVTLWQPPQGGHVGFPTGSMQGRVTRMPTDIVQWLHAHFA